MAPQHLRNQWLAPAARLFFFLNQPYLLEDRTLRQTLQNVHRALYTPQGLPKPPVVAAASVAAPANITSLPPRAPNYAVDSSGSDSDFRKPGVVNPQPKQYQAPVPYQQPQVRHAQAQQQMMSQQSMPQYPSMSQYPADPQQEQLINNLNITMPAMDPKKELDLYMKWLNVRYDALNKIAAAAAQAAAAGVPSNTATSATRPPNSIPMFPVTQAQRQSMMERISLHLRTVLMRRDAAAVVECVRRCEYELLLQAADFNEYQNDYNMGQRIVEVVNAHPEWRIPPVKLNVHGMIEFMSDAEVAARNATAAGNWRSLITPAIRQEMIARVEKMLKMVSNKLNIISKEDLDYKTQQYEMGLVISATSFAEYMDKATMPKRLANLVTDFADHKRTLPPEVFSTYLA